MIYEDVLSMIKELRRQQGISEDSKAGLFTKTNGKRYSPTYLSSDFKHLLYESPFGFVRTRKDPITAHTCRHYTAQYLIEQNADLQFDEPYILCGLSLGSILVLHQAIRNKEN